MSMTARDDRVFIIAEAGVNHNGDMDRALALVDAAADAGADAVKFQTFKAERLVAGDAPKADYQKRQTDAAETQLEMLRKLELDVPAHERLLAHCRERGIEFLSTPFDLESVDLLKALGVHRFKVPSGEITNLPLLERIAATGKPVLLSTGMSTLGDIEAALGILERGWLEHGWLECGDLPHPGAAPGDAGEGGAWGRQPWGRPAWGGPSTESAVAAPDASDPTSPVDTAYKACAVRGHVTVLHCNTQYPTPFADVNLRAMQTIRHAFPGVAVGFSDHTPGIAIPLAAAALGAVVIEKHFTLDRTLPGPDHAASLEPDELRAMVDGIRAISLALGDGRKAPTPSESPNLPIVRKSIVAARPIAAGETYTTGNLTVKRPGTGLSPMRWHEVLGHTAPRAFDTDEQITL